MSAQPDRQASVLEDARRLLSERGADVDLYHQWFHRTTGRFRQWPMAGAYRAAILDAERFEPGWRVLDTAPSPAGACVALRGGHQRIVAPPELMPDDLHALTPRRGATLRVHPLTSAEAAGFWHVWSAGWQRSAPAQIGRVYFRVRDAHAIDLAVGVVAQAPPRAVWAMKALCGTHDDGRRDGALLYRPIDASLDDEWFVRVLDVAQPLCDDDLPPFVEPLRTGIGWAPDPGNDRSFGQAVSDAVATAAGFVADPAAFTQFAIAAIEAIPGMKVRPREVQRA